MNAINHAATALMLKRRWPEVPLLPLLISVQLIEFLWALFCLAGIEVTRTGPTVRSIADIHLDYMPYSHSIGSTVAIATLCWFVLRKPLHRAAWALPVACGVISHIVLDVLVHARDIALVPGLTDTKIGSGLYDVPELALLVELAYGVLCWRVYGGSRALLFTIVGLNLAAAPFYLPELPGPQALLSGHPKVFAAVILAHIVLGLSAIGFMARRETPLHQQA